MANLRMNKNDKNQRTNGSSQLFVWTQNPHLLYADL
jgi:hypothetical protein